MTDVRALIVDDNDLDRYLLNRTIEDSGYTPTTFEAENGLVALELLSAPDSAMRESDAPIVLFLDINMPLMNGFQFLEEYEARKTRGDAILPVSIVSMLTSSQYPEDIERAMAFPSVENYFLKMPESEQLAEIFGELMAA